MKIYILPYTNKTFFSKDKRVSGIDAAALTQFKILKELGYEVRMWTAFGDIHSIHEGIDYYIEDQIENLKEYERKNKKAIFEKMLTAITRFKPDLIFSNYEFSSIYQRLIGLNIPLIYNSHSIPQSWNDLNNGNLLHQFLELKNTLICVSEFHKNWMIKYYSGKRSIWNFNGITPDDILYPQYCSKEVIKPSDNIVRHISAASKSKDTFLINKLLNGTEFDHEVYTTFSYLGCKMDDPYIVNAIENYKDKIFLDVKHADIMERIGSSLCGHVGNAPDTFTITSLEFLSRGVPLIVKGINGKHPAQEMVEESCQKYVYVYKNKTDFLEKVRYYQLLDYNERLAIAQSAFNKMNKEQYKNKIEKIVNYSVDKYSNDKKKSIGLDEFL